jgi:hypothetical protein
MTLGRPLQTTVCLKPLNLGLGRDLRILVLYHVCSVLLLSFVARVDSEPLPC